MEDRIENLRKQVIKVFNEDLCDENLLNTNIYRLKEISANINRVKKGLVTELEALAREKMITKEDNIKYHDSLRKFNTVRDNILRIQKDKYEDKIILLSSECINNLEGLFMNYHYDDPEYYSCIMLYLKEFLIYQVSFINLCMSTYRDADRVRKLFSFLSNIRPDYTDFYCVSKRVGHFFTNCKIMSILAILPDIFYANSLKYISIDFIKNIYLWFRGSNHDKNYSIRYDRASIAYFCNDSLNLPDGDIVKDYLNNFKEFLEKYGYKF